MAQLSDPGQIQDRSNFIFLFTRLAGAGVI